MDFSTLDPISIAVGVGIGLILAFLFSQKGASAGQEINHDIQKNEPKVATMCPLKDNEDTVSKSDKGGGEDGDGDADQTSIPLESECEKNKRAAIQRVMKDKSLTPVERNQAILKSFRAVSKSDKGGGEDGDADQTMTSPEPLRNRNRPHLTVDTSPQPQPATATTTGAVLDGSKHDPKTSPGLRGHSDVNSIASPTTTANTQTHPQPEEPRSPLADFITQTDKYDNATTPCTAEAITSAGPKPLLHVDSETGVVMEGDDAIGSSPHHHHHRGGSHEALDDNEEHLGSAEDTCEKLLDSLRTMCCCLLPEGPNNNDNGNNNTISGTTGGENGNKKEDHSTSSIPLESDREKNKRAAIQRVMKDTSLTPVERNQAILKIMKGEFDSNYDSQ